MSKIKLMLAVAIGALALYAAAAGSASAAGWFLAGTKMTPSQSAAVASTAALSAPLVISTPSIGLTLTCDGTVLVREGIIHTDGTYLSKEIVFHSCTSSGLPECTLGSSEIKFNALTGLARLASSPEDRITFKATTKATLATLPFTGANCPGAEVPLNGEFTLKMPTGQSELSTQLLEGLGSVENNSLELASSKTFFEGGGPQVQLAFGPTWSFH
jgi:hypothetical protein